MTANPSPHRKATKHASRRANLGTALELASQDPPTSRAEIARQTGLTRAAVSSLVSELLDDGLLSELGPGSSAGGKPPTLLSFNERGRDVVAVDLGNQPFRGGIVDLSGAIHERIETGCHDLSGEAAVEAALFMIGELLLRAQALVLGVGVGTPGVVNANGLVIEASNLDWHELDIGSRLRTEFGFPVSTANDAQMAALAEHRRYGAASSNVLVVKIGRGIGAGVVIAGNLHRGDHFAAGEIGRIQVVPEGALCRCGNRGCLETVASIPAILRSLGADYTHESWHGKSLAGSAGESSVGRAIGLAGQHLGAVLAHAVALLDITRIVVDGFAEHWG